jgi:hypothetical protein
MSFDEATAIGMLVFFLVALLVYPGELQWGRRPWFAKGPPSRPLFVAIVAGALVVAGVHALR